VLRPPTCFGHHSHCYCQRRFAEKAAADFAAQETQDNVLGTRRMQHEARPVRHQPNGLQDHLQRPQRQRPKDRGDSGLCSNSGGGEGAVYQRVRSKCKNCRKVKSKTAERGKGKDMRWKRREKRGRSSGDTHREQLGGRAGEIRYMD